MHELDACLLIIAICDIIGLLIKLTDYVVTDILDF